VQQIGRLQMNWSGLKKSLRAAVMPVNCAKLVDHESP